MALTVPPLKTPARALSKMRVGMQILLASSWILFLPHSSIASSQWVPTSPESFVTTYQSAFRCLRSNQERLTELGYNIEALNDYYLSFASRAYGVDGQLLDLDDRQLRVTYLALKKLVVHCDSLDRMGIDFGPPRGDVKRSGVYDERSEIIGIKAKDLAYLRSESENYPAILRFGFSLYNDVNSCPDLSSRSDTPLSRMYMLPTSAETDIRQTSSKALDSYLANYGVPRAEAIMEGSYGTTSVNSNDDTWTAELRMPLNLSSSSTRSGSRFTYVAGQSGRYLYEDGEPISFYPTELVVLHELGHIERISIGEGDEQFSDDDRLLFEIGPSLEDIVRADTVLKRAQGRPLDEIVDYRFKLPSRTGDLNPGVVANYFRPLIESHGSAERALLSPEGLKFVLKHYDNSKCD